MANLTKNSQWEKAFTLTKQNNSIYTLSTTGQYLDRNIQLTMNVQGATTTASAATANATIYTMDDTNGGINISNIIGAQATTEPTSGYYLAVEASGSGGSTVTQAGWIAAGGLTSASASGIKYFPVTAATCTVSGGDLSVGTAYAATPTLTLSSGANTNMTNITIGPQDTANYAYYFKVNGNTNALTGAIPVTRGAVSDTHTAGYLPVRNATEIIAASTTNANVNISASSADTYVSIAEAKGSISMSAGNGSCSLTSNANVVVTGSDTYKSGVSVTFSGSGTVTANAAITTAGYAPTTLTFDGIKSLSSSSATATKYIQGVTLTKPTSGERQFSITVPNGDSTIMFVFHVYANGDVLVDDAFTS